MENIKKFEDFLDRMQGLLDNAKKQGHILVRVDDLENTFPELAESEDEKIRKGITELVKQSSEILDKKNQERMLAWLEKQGKQKEYTFKSIPRLLDMIEPTERAKAYCQKLIDTLKQEGYDTDAKIVEECLKQMNGEHVAMAVMDEKQSDNLVENGYTNNKDIIKYADDYSHAIWHKLMDNFKNIEDYHIGCNDVSDIVLNTIIDAYNWIEEQGEKPQGKTALEAINEEKVDNANKIEPADYNSSDPHFGKPIDKIEPKFRIEKGKWYVCIRELLDDYGNRAFCKGDVYLSEKDGYLIPCNSNVPWELTYCVDTYFRNWDISDAKDGDVLYFNDNTIVIFKDLYNATTFHSYCHIEDGVFDISKDDMPNWWEGKGFHPATKEQRDILMKAIADAGYEWNAEKNELTLLITNGGDFF